MDDSPAISCVPDGLRRKRCQVVDTEFPEENDHEECDERKHRVPEPCPVRESKKNEEHGKEEEITPGIEEVIPDCGGHRRIWGERKLADCLRIAKFQTSSTLEDNPRESDA